jgi:PAS domain S-box-containing protein
MSGSNDRDQLLRFYKSIFETSLDAILLTKPDGSILAANPTACHMFGMSKEEFKKAGRKGIVVIDEKVELALKKRAQIGSVKTESTFKRKDGTTFPGELTSTLFTDNNGTVNASIIIRDITARKKAEFKLLHANERLNIASQSAGAGIWDWDIKSGKIEWSPVMFEILGLDPKETTPSFDAWISTIHPEDINIASVRIDQAVKDHSFLDSEFRIIKPGGEIRWINALGRTEYDNEGSPLWMTGICMDITRRQKADEELKRINIELSEMTVDLQTILDIAPIVIWIAHDPECRSITGNAYADKIMKVHRGGNISRSAPIEDQAVSYQVFQNGIELNPDELPAQVAAAIGEPVEESELDLVFPDGRIVKLLLGAVPLFNIEGKVRGAIAAGMDITHYKLIEESLRESEERLRLAQTRGNVGVWDWNTITDELNFTPELEQLYGLSPGSIKTYQDWRQLTHPDDIVKIESERDDKIAKHEPFDLEFRIFHKSGDMRWLSARGGAIYNKKGDVVRVLGINTDITEHKQAEEQVILRTEELAKSNADLKQFAYVASHDLREPLRMITSFLQLLERRYKNQLDEEAKEYIGFAVDGALRLDDMIKDLLEYSRITRIERCYSNVNFEEVLDHTLTNLDALIEEKNAMITHDPLPSIFADEHLMLRLFQNLLSNAIKYHGEEPPRVHVSAVKEGEVHVFSVKDNGIGMDSKYLEKIFTIFKRLHKKDEYEGTGIGLSIAQKIVHRHGGEIWAESNLGEGSTFYFTLPSLNISSFA